MKKKKKSQLDVAHHETALHHDLSFRDRSADAPHCGLSRKERENTPIRRHRGRKVF
jgi:hypothetical protein